MALKLAVLLRNARLDVIESHLGTSPILKIFAGTAPAGPDSADGAGAVLATVTLPSDWLSAASGGQIALSGTWQDASADNAGTATHFRLYTSGSVCKVQGTVTATGGGGDMTVDNVVFAAGQQFTVTSFLLTDGNA